MDSHHRGSPRVPTYHHYGSSSHTRDPDRHTRHQPNHRAMEEEDSRVDLQAFPMTSLSATTTTTSSSKYFEYPTTKPFVNTNFTRTDKPVNTYPTTDRDAVVSALRNLQDKVKNLELERNAAEKNLQTLAHESEQYRDVLTKGVDSDRSTKSPRPAQPPSSVSHQTKELEGQLSSAESRCHLLEQQLEYMRQMVDNSERDRRDLMQRTLLARQEKDQATSRQDVNLHLGRLHELEQDQMRLTATQTLAESKIKELEERVKQEKMHRKTLQERTAQLESANKQPKKSAPIRVSSSTQVPAKSPAPLVIRSKKPPIKKKKKKVVATKRPASAGHLRSEPANRHYRLNLAEIPFVAGKSTTPSHSLGANVQKVLAMMKSHNHALCSNHATSARCNGVEGQRSDSPTSESTESSTTVTANLDQDLSDVLVQLQDEFGQLSSEHQELMYQLHACRDQELRERLEQEMDSLVSRMEAKGLQISKVRQHQSKLEDVKKQKLSSRPAEKTKRPHAADSTNHNHHHHHPSVQKASVGPRSNCQKPIGNSALGNPALFMLRDMKKLQTTLRRDDLSWE